MVILDLTRLLLEFGGASGDGLQRRMSVCEDYSAKKTVSNKHTAVGNWSCPIYVILVGEYVYSILVGPLLNQL